MNKNALYFSLHIDSSNWFSMNYYSMLYNALESLIAVYDNSFDILVFYTFTDKGCEFSNYVHLDKFNLVRDFPNVQFIESDYSKIHEVSFSWGKPNLNDPWSSKWYHFEKTFNLGYRKVLFSDCDVIFIRNPSYLFDYSDHYFWTKYVSDSLESLLKNPPINSGHFLLDSKSFDSIGNFYLKVVEKRRYLNEKAIAMANSGEIDEKTLKHWLFFNEQYCAQEVLSDANIEFKEFLDSDIWLVYKIEHMLRSFHTIDVETLQTCILHYHTANAFWIIPPKLRTEILEAEYNRKVST